MESRVSYFRGKVQRRFRDKRRLHCLDQNAEEDGMKQELVDIVDKNDKVLKTIDRGSATDSDILRVSGIFIINNKEEILLQLRSEKSHRYPRCWDCSGGGHADAGEDYATGAARELFEEVGIKTELVFLGKHFIKLDDGRKRFIAFFKGQYNGKIKVDPREVSKAIFFAKDDIKRMIKSGEKIHPECLFGLKKYFL